MTHAVRIRSARALLVSGVLLLAVSGSADASNVTASETVTAGSLAFVNSTPGNVAFPGVTLNGTSAQTTTKPQALDVNDATGSGAGWNITATSTTFVNANNNTLPTTATVVNATPSQACDNGVTCTLASNSIAFPYTLPAASTAPTATKLYNAATNSGMAAQTITPTWSLTVPAAASAGSYSSTWTLSLASAP